MYVSEDNRIWTELAIGVPEGRVRVREKKFMMLAHKCQSVVKIAFFPEKKVHRITSMYTGLKGGQWDSYVKSQVGYTGNVHKKLYKSQPMFQSRRIGELKKLHPPKLPS